MARKKSVETATVEAPARSYRTRNAVVLRATDDWTAWLSGVARDAGMPATVFVEQAIRREAKRLGAPPPPPRLEAPKKILD